MTAWRRPEPSPPRSSTATAATAAHSRVREWVTGGDEPRYSETSGFRGLVPVERLPQLPDPEALQFWAGPGAHLLHYPVSGGRLINFLAVVEGPERWTAPAWMETAAPGAHLAAFDGWHPAVTEMIGAVPQSPRWGLFARRPLAHWNRGPVVLLGDAAHAMLPHHGQGANQTIEDADVLAAELAGTSDVIAAVRRYAARRRARTRQVQLVSWAASAALHLPDGPAARRRDADLARLPERMAWIHGYDALAPGPAARDRDPRPARRSIPASAGKARARRVRHLTARARRRSGRVTRCCRRDHGRPGPARRLAAARSPRSGNRGRRIPRRC